MEMLIHNTVAGHYAGSVCLPLILSFVCLTELEEFLLATKSQSVAAKERKHCKTAGSGSGRGALKVRTLKAPFIKVEDMSRAYKPLVFEVKVWPTPNVHCSPEGSPFDSPPPRKERAKKRTERQAPAPPKQSAVPFEKKPGYCECCKAHFTDMKMVSLCDACLHTLTLCVQTTDDLSLHYSFFTQHLQGEQHLTFATNPKNYAALDELISRGTSFADFLLKHTKVKTAGSQSLQPTTAPDSKTKVVERTPGFITPGIVPGTKRMRPASDSADSGGNSPKRLKLVLSPSVPEETPGAVDSGVCLQPDTRCKTPVKASVVSSDVGQSPLLRSGRRLKRRLSQSDNPETPVPNSEAKKQAVASSPRTLTPDQCDTPPTPKRSPRLSSKMSPAEPKGTKSPLPPQTPQKDKKLPSFNVAVVVADVSPTQKGLKVVMSPASPCSQASTVSVTPRSAVASSASSSYSKPSRRKSLRYLAKKLNTSVSPDADWKLDQREAFQRSQTISLSSSTQSTPTRSAFSSAQPSPQSGLGRYGQSIIACTIPAETSSSKRQMPPRRCKKLSPPTVPVTSSNRKGTRRRR